MSSVTQEKSLFSLPLLHSHRGHKLHCSPSDQIQIDSTCNSEYDLKTAWGVDGGAEGSCSDGRAGDSKAPQLSYSCSCSKCGVGCVSALHVGMTSKKALCKYLVNQSINRSVMSSCKSFPCQTSHQFYCFIVKELNTALYSTRLRLSKNNRTNVNVLALAVTREPRVVLRERQGPSVLKESSQAWSEPHRPLLTPSTAPHSRVQPSGLISALTGWLSRPICMRATLTVGPRNVLVEEGPSRFKG